MGWGCSTVEHHIRSEPRLTLQGKTLRGISGFLNCAWVGCSTVEHPLLVVFRLSQKPCRGTVADHSFFAGISF